ncbi:30S ribosomal protein S20 [Staphylococcus warneri]|jgi:small subunit ribosomal protein S20|uniref:Small ribosomal subunit protein bS20 n=3 Tax=Staphylococcus TaxID=1279 RepID=A0A2T4PBP8_STAWA|nr:MULTISPECIES: 30S ribosomal protein S20 [Staphylococcus]MBE9428357.1 30S ribosomal protein S20 [Staphylococcus epidermidis]MBJ7884208.1 30S ribosomal protein S20 [Bacillaceae bacterium HSR45]MCR4455840.1 30S ribosomal protein S20 [Aeromonas salmonicida]ODB56470.1 30S ribosomal protein S20 [Staphylococcus sp. AOAB]POO68958.1 30S ribosomal protein S20 [Bacillus amyloliquefaciens]QAV31897.1 30S ribosomal protein S20 [Sulfitobacter donghicola]SKR88119.1 30S ribosomal protein S20 [Mycobacteroi
MPNIKSAVKRVKTTQTAEERNISKKNTMRTAVKRAKSAIETNADNKNELVSFAIKQLDKAAQSNLIHSNKADRVKSQLMSANK